MSIFGRDADNWWQQHVWSPLGNWISGQLATIPALQPYLDPYGNENEQNNLNRQFNAQQAQIDRDWQEKMWNLSNQYNSPQAQMQRYRDAGLNPSLMMSGGALSGAAATVPSGSQAAYSGNSSAGMGINPLQAMEVASRVSLNRAQADNLESRTDTENQLRQARLDNLLALVRTQDAKVADYISQIKKRVHENALTDAQRENIGFEQMFKSNQLAIDWSRLQNETKMTDASVEKLKAEREEALARARVTNREYDEMCWTFAVRAAGLEAQVGLTQAQTEQAKATAKRLQFEADMLEGPAEYERWFLERTDNGTALQGILGITRYTIQSAIRSLHARIY